MIIKKIIKAQYYIRDDWLQLIRFIAKIVICLWKKLEKKAN